MARDPETRASGVTEAVEPTTGTLDLADLERQGLHLEGADAEVDDSDTDLEHVARYGALEDLIDAFADGFNAHDPEALLEVLSDDVELPGLGEDRSGFPMTMDDVWERRPHAVLVRGLLDDEPVGVCWDVVGDGGSWQRIAVLTFDSADGPETGIGVIEVYDDPGCLDRVEVSAPEPEAAEGARWEEWYEGEE